MVCLGLPGGDASAPRQPKLRKVEPGEYGAHARAHLPNKHVLVKASRVEYKSFSCYDNFVPSNNAGVPEHTPTHNALQHGEVWSS
ncbi:UPF0565 protein C2orf69 homolog [Manduca sexta]|uniref:UPF0565 protein C2orf69 homolog n=1 Tax=Manduca sexta TaxID=7130 RepID=UPI00188F239B|nr:UPF0565 protein C2orf69 homolog [Manduca sexta]